MGKLVNELKTKFINGIKECLKNYGMAECHWTDINEGYSPILQEDVYDENDTYTLDSVDEKGVWGSSSCDNHYWLFEQLDIEVLEEIYEGLTEYGKYVKDEIYSEVEDSINSIVYDEEENADFDGFAEKVEGLLDVKLKFVDEKIDEGIDEGEDEYLMMSSYDFAYRGVNFYLRVYYGNNTLKIGSISLTTR